MSYTKHSLLKGHQLAGHCRGSDPLVHNLPNLLPWRGPEGLDSKTTSSQHCASLAMDRSLCREASKHVALDAAGWLLAFM